MPIESMNQSYSGRWFSNSSAQIEWVIFSIDNRGTPAPRSRAWRKSIYRQMGIRNSLDQANAVRAITKWPFVDSSRIGIWGWSGGGSSSLNAIFRYPDLYRVAMSVAPVPDIRYYDTIYQERYCGLPQDHPEEYEKRLTRCQQRHLPTKRRGNL